jgi:hypothetical protein
MIHAENERFSISMLRGVAYALTIFRRASCEPLEPIPPQRTLICLNFQGWQPGRKRQAHDGSMSFC